MTTKRCHQHQQKGCGIIIFALMVCVLINSQFCQGNDNIEDTEVIRARIFVLNNISAQRGKFYLTKLGIGDTVLPIPGDKAMSVTGLALELVKASTVLNLVDSKKEYVIKKIALKSTDIFLNFEELDKKVGADISIGSLISRPVGNSLAEAIVDRRNDELIIVATQEYIGLITEAVIQLEDKTTRLPVHTSVVPKPSAQRLSQQSRNIAAEVDEFPKVGNLASNKMPGVPDDEEVRYDARKELVIPNGDDPVNIDLPEKLEIVQLIELVGKYLNLDYLYDETKVKGNVTVKIQGRLKVRDLYKLLENVLKFRGFVMSRDGNLVTIVPTAEALDTDPVFSDVGIQPGDVVVTRIFALNYITTAAAKKVLTEMKLGANINEIPESGMLIITGFAYRMSRIEQFLELVDVPGEERIFKLRELKYTLVTSLVPKLQEMAGKLGSISVTIAEKAAPVKKASVRRRERGRSAPAPDKATAAQKFEVYIDYDERTNRVLMIGRISEIATVEELIDALDVPQQDLRMIHEYKIRYVGIEDVVDALGELGIISGQGSGGRSRRSPLKKGEAPATPLRGIDEPQVVQMESANSLLVNATPEQHIQMAQIISYVDREPEQASIPYRIYRLEYQEPSQLAGTLNEIVEKTIKDEKGKIQKKITREEDIAIIADEKAFSIIVYANKRNQEWIGQLIGMLDKRRPQVLIDVTLVEVTRNDAFQYDLDIIGALPDLDVISGLTTPGSFDPTAILGLIAGAPDRNRLLDASSSGGRGKGFYGNKHIQALLTLMQEKGYGRIMAQPQVLVNDNEDGRILTTEKTYVREDTQSFPGEGRTPVTTTVWTPYEAKIELTITPQISEGNLLRLKITMLREDFIETIAGPPDYATSNIDTVVTVPDGSTIILGGLTKLDQTKGGTKIPLLGDIPFVGTLFRSVNNVDGERKLYIFVKANILRPDDAGSLAQLKEISRKNRADFEKAETEFQEYEGFPGVKPKVFEPRHVLSQMDEDSVAPEEPASTVIVELEPVTLIEEMMPAEAELETETEEIDSLEVLEGL